MRPIGLLTGIGVERGVGSWVALRPTPTFYNWLLGTPLGGGEPGPRMRNSIYTFEIQWNLQTIKSIVFFYYFDFRNQSKIKIVEEIHPNLRSFFA